MNFKRALTYLVILTTLGGIGYFILTMKEFADGVIEDSQRIEELKKARAIDKPINISEDSVQHIITDSAQVALHVKEWLTTTIVKFFDQDAHQDITDITTEQYAAYRQDALCVVYDCDPSLTEEEFKQKWSNIYDTSYARFGAGFLIDQQDWYEIVVTKCELTDQSIQGTYIFDTEITDTGLKLTHANEITVLLTDEGFKIDDVKKRK